ncbi:hypothetical protein ABZ260_50870, partial [Streptosporangium sp. NPDC006013]|uniref:hypothetical protein n=1 Tax=Streptosporangium sp. NPDC006013 TaxID=3155596 RepID=UPI0033A94FFB
VGHAEQDGAVTLQRLGQRLAEDRPCLPVVPGRGAGPGLGMDVGAEETPFGWPSPGRGAA